MTSGIVRCRMPTSPLTHESPAEPAPPLFPPYGPLIDDIPSVDLPPARDRETELITPDIPALPNSSPAI